MKDAESSSIQKLELRIAQLEKELKEVKANPYKNKHKDSVIVPEALKPIFDKAEKIVGKYFDDFVVEPSKGTITVNNERYLLVRASALSINFLETIANLYADKGVQESFLIGKNFLFDIAHIIGLNDAVNFHNKMGLTDPLEKMSAGPLHYSHTGWGLVKICPESKPSPDINFFIVGEHPYSFEADEWIKAGKKTDFPACIMSAGYSSGWCEESFGILLTAVEITCRAKGDEHCKFIIAHPDRIEEFVKEYLAECPKRGKNRVDYNIPTFFQRKKVEETLKAGEKRYRKLFEESNDAIIIYDFKGNIKDINPAGCEMLGEPKAILITKNIGLFDPEMNEKRMAEIFQKLMTEGSIRFESKVKRQNGEILEVDISSRVLDKEAGLIQGIARDITEKKRLEDQLRQSEKMQAIGELAGGIAHDFNNQLASILGFSNILTDQLEDEEMKIYADRILQTAKRSGELIKQLLAFARKGKYQSIPVDVNKIIGEVIIMLSHTIDKRITIKKNLYKTPLMTIGDPTQIQNAVLNIGINARDAMPTGGVLNFSTRRIQINEEDLKKFKMEIQKGEYLQIDINDTGVGMNDEVQKHIFEPFYTTKGKEKGVGMGLAAVYGTIKSHGGFINVMSQEDRGTTFTLYFPILYTKHVKVKEKPKLNPARVSGTILFVDDDATICEMANIILKRAGYQMELFQDGQKAIEFYQKHWKKIDLVILDMVMPKISGREIYRAIKKINPKVKTMLSSGHSLEGQAQEGMEEGVLAFLQKPYMKAELLEKITLVFRNSN